MHHATAVIDTADWLLAIPVLAADGSDVDFAGTPLSIAFRPIGGPVVCEAFTAADTMPSTCQCMSLTMATSSFDAALARALVYEGGYSDHPADPGGATNLGITIGTLSSWLGRPATKAEVRALTKADVAPIYRRNYWNKCRCDELPAGVDMAVFDFAVNSGPGRAIPALQRALGVADDGKLGPVTLAAAGAQPATRTAQRICEDRLAFLRRLSTWPTFGKGWQRRVEDLQAACLKMAANAPVAAKPAPSAPAVAPAAPQAPTGLLARLKSFFVG